MGERENRGSQAHPGFLMKRQSHQGRVGVGAGLALVVVVRAGVVVVRAGVVVVRAGVVVGVVVRMVVGAVVVVLAPGVVVLMPGVVVLAVVAGVVVEEGLMLVEGVVVESALTLVVIELEVTSLFTVVEPGVLVVERVLDKATDKTEELGDTTRVVRVYELEAVVEA